MNTFIPQRTPLVILLAISTFASASFANPTSFANSTNDTESSRDELRDTLKKALEDFDRGASLINTQPNQAIIAFQSARDGFETAATGLENGKLYYNLGNTYMRLQQVGRAIAAYRMAERLIPGDAQLDANLRYARKIRRDQIESGGEQTFLHTLFFLHYRFPVGTRVTIALIAYALFWLALLSRLNRRTHAPKYMAPTFAILWLSLGVSIAVSQWHDTRTTEGVLINNEVTIRKGNGETYEPQFNRPLHEGVEFRVINQRGGWVHLELPDGNRGWIRKSDAIIF